MVADTSLLGRLSPGISSPLQLPSTLTVSGCYWLWLSFIFSKGRWCREHWALARTGMLRSDVELRLFEIGRLDLDSPFTLPCAMRPEAFTVTL